MCPTPTNIPTSTAFNPTHPRVGLQRRVDYINILGLVVRLCVFWQSTQSITQYFWIKIKEFLTSFICHDDNDGLWSTSFGVKHFEGHEVLGVSVETGQRVALKQTAWIKVTFHRIIMFCIPPWRRERLLISSLLCPQQCCLFTEMRKHVWCTLWLESLYYIVSGPSLQCPRHTKWQGRKTCKSWFHQGSDNLYFSNHGFMPFSHLQTPYTKCIYIAKKYLWPLKHYISYTKANENVALCRQTLRIFTWKYLSN